VTLTVSPTQNAVCIKLDALIVDIVPAGTQVLRGPINRAAQPKADHVIYTPIFLHRLRTNVETDVDPFPAPDPGTMRLEQGTRLDFQVDFYGGLAADWAAMFTTIMRSEYGVDKLAPDAAPLYADEARNIPLVTGEEQFLERWTVRAVLQYNPVTTVLQQYAGTAAVDIINVDEAYPP
jgi:hypothetical protein